MKALVLIITLAIGVLAAPFGVHAQAPVKAARIGWLRSAPETPEVRRDLDAFTQELRDHGYSVGQNVTIAFRSPTERTTPLSALMGELLQFQADVIVTGGPAATEAARQATTTVPIVATDLERDPVASGLVERYSHPGGNLTGVFLDFPAFSGKWLELLREVVPGLARVAVLWDPATGPMQLRGLESAARPVGVQLHVLEVRRVDDFAGAFRAAMPAQPDAVIALSSPLVSNHRQYLAALAVTHRLPAITLFPSFAREEGLMAYGPDITDIFRQAARLVVKILHGAKPADLPIERPMQFKLVINLKTAQDLGLTIPPTLLMLADEVIR
jgi:putative ABC transport system substrate-binding protein